MPSQRAVVKEEDRAKRTSGKSVPSVRKTKRYSVAVLLSDVHLSLKPPVYRSVEKDWLATQAGYLNQVKKLAETKWELGASLPVICGGDVFDKWNSPPELINFAISYLPVMWSIPGQHDLPGHNYEDIYKSAYWTLVEAGKIVECTMTDELDCKVVSESNQLRVWGHMWGIEPRPKPNDAPVLSLDLCIAHSYIWTKTTGYPTASQDKRLRAYKSKLQGYDVALFGDNHKSVFYNLDKSKPGPSIFNPGSLMRRNSDQRDHFPCVGLLYNDGTIEPKYLDVSEDKTLEQEQFRDIKVDGMEISKFIGELMKLQETHVDFEMIIKRRLDDVKAGFRVRRIVMSALEDGK